MPTVSVPPPFRGPTQGAASVDVEGSSVRACLEAVETRHPGFRELVLNPDGTASKFVKLFLNGEPVEDLEAAVADGDEVAVLAAIGGG